MSAITAVIKAGIPLVLLSQIACSSNGSVDTAAVEELDWVECDDAVSFECTSLSVPMNHNQPEGEKIEIALTRRAASGADRQGSLLFNFGGPGGTGVVDLQLFVEEGLIPESLLSAYDLVGFDPRGVGGSTPVDCTEEGAGDVNQYPFNAKQIAQLSDDYSRISDACSAKYGDYLQHLGSLNVVRDMDKIRIALGDDELNFLGISYGTRLAALYLQEFPESSGRVVLDASLTPDTSIRNTFLGSLPAMQQHLLSLLSTCKTDNPSCDSNTLANNLTDRINTSLLDNSEASRNEALLVLQLILAAADSAEFSQLIAPPLVEYVNTFDVAVLELFVIEFLANGGGEDNSDDGESEGDAGVIVETAVLCADDGARPNVETLVSTLNEFNQVSDLFAEFAVSAAGQCAGWPDALEPLAPIVTNTAPVSLVIGGVSDVFTPIAWSEEMASQIGGVFIRSHHTGHTGVFVEKSDCLDGIVETFFLDGMTPVIQECL